MSTQTAEMDELEKIKVYYQYKARLQGLKIDRLKLQLNLAKLDDEEKKIKLHLDQMPNMGE